MSSLILRAKTNGAEAGSGMSPRFPLQPEPGLADVGRPIQPLKQQMLPAVSAVWVADSATRAAVNAATPKGTEFRAVMEAAAADRQISKCECFTAKLSGEQHQRKF